MDVFARDAPLGQEVNRPAIHSHRPDGQDQRELFARIATQLDRQRDLMPEHHVEIGEAAARHQLELLVPPLLTHPDVRRVGIDARIDLVQIPTGGKKAFHQRARQRTEQVHRRVLFLPE